jgi:hypothetical protein
MKTRVLVRTAPDGDEWVASAYQAEKAVCTARAASDADAMEELKAQLEEGLATLPRP